MSASANDKITQSMNGGNPVVTTVSSSRSIGGTSLSAVALTNWPTDTRAFFTTYQKTTAGLKDFNTVTSWWAIVSGTTLGTLTRMGGAADAGNAVGDYIEMGPTAAWAEALYEFGTTIHNTDGTLKDGIIATIKLADSSVTSAKVAPGAVVQVVATNYAAVATGTTVIPEDDTMPQITEGTEFMAQAITPKSATNRLQIKAEIAFSTSNINSGVAALFQDSTANALAAKECYIPVANATGNIVVTHDMVAGTTSATTFRLRAGPAVAGTLTFNGFNSARKFGGITLSSITVTEYKA